MSSLNQEWNDMAEMSKSLLSWIVCVVQLTCLTALQIGCLYRVETWLKVSESEVQTKAAWMLERSKIISAAPQLMK